MRLLVIGAVTAIATLGSFNTKAADFAFPPAGSSPYAVAPVPAVTPPQVIIVPGPAAPPQYYSGAPGPPPAVGSYPYGIAPPAAPGSVAPGHPLPPRGACAPVWRCGDRGCGWQPGCVPRPEAYSGHYGLAGPQVYSGPEPAPEPYSSPYGSSGPQVYYGPDTQSPREPYSSGPQIYSSPAGRMNWLVGKPPYGM
jgi:hypothetical protein